MEQSVNTGNETVNTAINSLIDQFAQIKFEGMVMYGVFLVVALIICFEGYQIYRLALLIMGFAIGYTQSHLLIGYIPAQLTSEQMLMVQVIAGIVCAVLSTTLVRVGVFLSAYVFAKKVLAAPAAAFALGLISQKTQVPQFLNTIISNIVGVIVAYFVAKLAADSLRKVIVILTAAVGGFTMVSCFIQLIPFFPYDLSFMPSDGSIIWLGAKVLLTCAGVGIQGLEGDN